MIYRVIWGLICAWLLSAFGFDTLMTNGILELTGVTITTSTYYLIIVLLNVMRPRRTGVTITGSK